MGDKMKMNGLYKYKTSPVANSKSVVMGDKYRFTILTSRLIRAEYNETGNFEDRATQAVINRDFPVVEYSVVDKDDILTITTENIKLTYYKRHFDSNSLFVKYLGKDSGVVVGDNLLTEWGFEKLNNRNLKGTARTLDKTNGECELEYGLMSDGSVTILDDSKSLIIADDGWIESRKEIYTDTYLFCYGDIEKNFDCKACLKDFYKLCGKVPLLPKYALGNWWSRFYPYTQDEYIELIKKFKADNIPFSVAVLDVDWHYVKIDSKYGNGWTGYSWNKELFPNHKEFLEFLHHENLEVSLNLHPQQGVAAHEDAYKDMANAMGIDPETEKTVEFDITNPRFLENYFKYLHHPLEEEGVGFWWMDWQQGNTTCVPGLDPLWMLNHYHYIDNDRTNKRPLDFSRYSGIGSHRYPVGFSGDTYITWESLDFQPYFTANASNVGYGWWSHDIGGHMGGYRDEELSARWVQFGVFSPINRLHSNNSPFMGKEPWKFNKISELSMNKFLRLRYELIPYLYTMNYRASEYGEPLMMPLYYNWSTMQAYRNRNEYTFGTEMLVKPITKPHDKYTTMGSTAVWFPEGEWYDFFNNRRYSGGRTLTVYRDLYEMPVFVKAGGIVPMATPENVNDLDNPVNMKIKIYAGADNTFEMYEDDGRTKDYIIGKYAKTNMNFKWGENCEFTINATEGDASVIPESRNYEIEFIGIESPEKCIASLNGNEIESKYEMKNGVFTVLVCGIKGELKIFLAGVKKNINNVISDVMTVIERSETDNFLKQDIFALMKNSKNTLEFLSSIKSLSISDDLYKAIMEIYTADLF